MLKFDWRPVSYEAVVKVLGTAPSQVKEEIHRVIGMMGPLSCPSPIDNPDGEYRVDSLEQRLVIQRKVSETQWEQVYPKPTEEDISVTPGPHPGSLTVKFLK